MARLQPLAGGLLLVLTGCATWHSWFEPEKSTELAWQEPTPATPSALRKTNYAPATQEVAWRVEGVGRKLAGIDSPYGMRPLFATIGSKQPEIFHVGTQVVYVTEGLVSQCKSDAELAAVLASELGKMVSEREARTDRAQRDPDRLPPVRLPIGTNGFGNDAVDPTNVVELARFEKEHPRNRRATRLEPQVVARAILQKGGYQESDLSAAEPILQAAYRNTALEDQFKGNVKQADWKP